ncbi:MAG: TldD/PmbA family protein [Nitrospira sp.]|nr:MAG: TldD/PmbA family protein [Nitrospira sp.]
MKHSAGDHTVLSIRDVHGGTTRFANNQVIQNVHQRRGTLSITVAFGRQQGSASTTDFTAGAVRETLKQAERIARVSPEDPEYLPPVGAQAYLGLPTSRPETAAAGPARRLDYAREAIGQCKMENLNAAGTVSSSLAVVGLAADTGLTAYEERTEARFSLTVQAGDATGWAAAAHRSLDRLHIQERTLTAISKAKRGDDDPQELPPGRYTVILEPAAVSGLLSGMLWTLDAKSFDKGTSPFSGKLGARIIDRRLSLVNQPDHVDLLGYSFTSEGLPVFGSCWIEAGVLKQLLHDRYTAQQHQVDRIATLESPVFSGERPIGTRVEDLIRTTQRGILVTNFWYIRLVNPSDLTLTGMTRDGTFLVENGEIVSAVRNFRFHDSPLRVFNHLDAYTAPAEAVTSETGKALVPAMRIDDFNFSSVTRF